MFEHFGIRDVFSSLRKYKGIVCVVILLSLLFGAYRGVCKINSQNDIVESDLEDSFKVSSASYIIEPAVTFNSDELNIYKEFPSQTASILMTDFCKKYVFTEIKKLYSEEEIMKKIEYLDIDDKQSLNFNILDKLFFAYQYENTMVIELVAESKDEQFTKDLINIYRSYFEQEYVPSVKNTLNVLYIDTVDQTFNSDKSMIETLLTQSKDSTGKIAIALANQMTVSVNPIKVMFKSIVIPFIIAVTICLIVVFCITLFNPTLNRETDFLQYDIPVIGEIYLNKKQYKGGK